MIDPQVWNQKSLAFRLGNIGSELHRARKADETQASVERDASLLRALDLIDLTLMDRTLGEGLKEIARLREVVCDWYAGTGVYPIAPQELEDYCLQMTVAQRN